MTWLYWLIGAALFGVAALAIWQALRSPTVLAGLSAIAARAAANAIVTKVAKRNPPEIEAKMHECVRRGGEWDNFNKKCRDR